MIGLNCIWLCGACLAIWLTAKIVLALYCLSVKLRNFLMNSWCHVQRRRARCRSDAPPIVSFSRNILSKA